MSAPRPRSTAGISAEDGVPPLGPEIEFYWMFDGSNTGWHRGYLIEQYEGWSFVQFKRPPGSHHPGCCHWHAVSQTRPVP